MAFPFLFHENFEQGTRGGFTSESADTLGKLDFPDHNDDLDIKPWRGGYVMRVALDRGTDAAYVQHDTALDMVNGETRYIRFMLRMSPDFKIPPAAGSSVKIFSVFSATDVEEVSLGITRSDSQTRLRGPRLSIWSPDNGEFIEGLSFDIDRWMPIEITISHTATTSRVYLHLGENTVQVGRMDFATFTHFRLGAMAQAPKVRGTLYFDDFLISTTKLEEQTHIEAEELWDQSILYTKSSYAFVGPGKLRGATLIGGGADNLAYLYDTDRLPIAHHDARGALKVAAAESKDTLVEDIQFHRGCYVEMSGTNPQVIIHYGPKP